MRSVPAQRVCADDAKWRRALMGNSSAATYGKLIVGVALACVQPRRAHPSEIEQLHAAVEAAAAEGARLLVRALLFLDEADELSVLP